MPELKPVPIKTKGKGFWKYSNVLLSTRNWEITKDWKYKINGNEYIIPAGFVFDGASIPKFLRTFFSPVGVLLMNKFSPRLCLQIRLFKKNCKGALLIVDQKRSDEIFRDICIEVNGFYTMNYLEILIVKTSINLCCVEWS